ncbi:Severe Depolymerization of Actin [Physocladia obscura]|uniref:Protein SDA1 n=1 Tax=Physocladia obscura TaxID=109957 RepID=A0AAD5X6R6_9FUNG|nr:Severe Depolymerization of Actin [Physocladia obscura]
MVELYTKNVWNDAKTVNVIAEAVFSPHPKIASTAVHFFLGTNDDRKDDADEDENVDINAIKHRLQINKKKGSKSNAVEKAMASIKRKARAKERAEIFNFSALHLLHSAQDFSEKLYITPYLAPHQRLVPRLLAFTAQASHELVPPDVLMPVVQTIADKFIWSNSAPEVVVAGLNSIREICQRSPLAMSEELLDSLIEDYKNHRDKGSMMAVRALLALYRDVNPQMLKKKHRGKSASMNLGKIEAPSFGSVKIMDMIEGADLLLEEEDEEAKIGEDSEDPGEGWDGWEIDSDAEKAEEKRKRNAKAVIEILDGADSELDNEEDAWSDEDESEEKNSSGGDNDNESENEDDEENDENDEVEDNGDNESAKQKLGPKAQRLAKQEARRNLEKQLEINPKKKKKVVQSLTERIYTDEDFEKMRELAANRKAEILAGISQSRARVLMNEDDEENGEALDRDVIDPRRIIAGVKRKSTYQERLDSIMEGREGREKFGSKKGKKKEENGGSTTNREKQKKTKNFQMVAHKRSVVGKKTRSLREKQRVLRAHISKQKKKGF